MQLFKLDLVSRGKVAGKHYYYIPIVKIGNDYFRCQLLKTTQTLKKDKFDISGLKPESLIKPKYYKANGIKLN
jgi:hypothetical protein